MKRCPAIFSLNEQLLACTRRGWHRHHFARYDAPIRSHQDRPLYYTSVEVRWSRWREVPLAPPPAPRRVEGDFYPHTDVRPEPFLTLLDATPPSADEKAADYQRLAERGLL